MTTDPGNNAGSCQKGVFSSFGPDFKKGHSEGAQNDVSAETTTHYFRFPPEKYPCSFLNRLLRKSKIFGCNCRKNVILSPTEMTLPDIGPEM